MAETRRHTPPNDVLSGIKRTLFTFRLSMYGVYMLSAIAMDRVCQQPWMESNMYLFMWCLCRSAARNRSHCVANNFFCKFCYIHVYGLLVWSEGGKEGVATGRLRVLQTAWTWTLPPHISRGLSRLPFLSYIIHILFSVTLRLSQAFVCSMFWIFMWLLIFICLRATFKVQTLRAWEHVWCDTDDKKKFNYRNYGGCN